MAEKARTGVFLGYLPKTDPRSDAFNEQWDRAVGTEWLKQQGHTPESFMQTLPESDEGAVFTDAPGLLYIRRHKAPEDGPTVPMSGNFFDPMEVG